MRTFQQIDMVFLNISTVFIVFSVFLRGIGFTFITII